MFLVIRNICVVRKIQRVHFIFSLHGSCWRKCIAQEGSSLLRLIEEYRQFAGDLCLKPAVLPDLTEGTLCVLLRCNLFL